jgi:hypothetical protein
MRFPQLEEVGLPAVFESVIPGKLHADGRRYLPVVVLRLPDHGDLRIGVVDRHHVVDTDLAGRAGLARLVFLLSVVQVQEPPARQGVFAEEGAAQGVSRAPLACGRVTAVPTWEMEREHLPYESLYTELILDVGGATVGVRTSATAASLAETIGLGTGSTIGKPRIEPGDWLCVRRSRVDILAFEA